MDDTSASQLTCVFWNVNKNDRTDLICDLVAEQDADVVVLAENGADSSKVLERLQSRIDQNFFEPITEIENLSLFARTSTIGLREIFADVSGRVTIRRLSFLQQEFLLVAVHLASKVNWDDDDQAAEAAALANEIRQAELRVGHSRTVLVGDLNMNPFEKGMVHANGFHGVTTRSTALRRSRKVQGREYSFFYNPMWGFFGDRTSGPPGTIFHRHSGHKSVDWNIFDQVLIRPDALPWFDDTIDIVTQIGDTNLLSNRGRPQKAVGSDHLPIMFRLALRKRE